jgi:SulP family sulfate permease
MTWPMGVLSACCCPASSLRTRWGSVLFIVRSPPEDDGRSGSTASSGRCSSASRRPLSCAFDYKEVIERVRIDVSRAHFWDITAVSALDKVVIKFRREGTEAEVIGLNEASATMVDRFAVHDKPDAVARPDGSTEGHE